MTVVPFKTPEQQLRDSRKKELTERVEALLEDVKSGHIIAIAYAAIHDDKTMRTGWLGGARKLREHVSVLLRRLDDACERSGL